MSDIQTSTLQASTIEQSVVARLLTNQDIKRWHDNLARSSKLTAKTYLCNLYLFCRKHEMTIPQVAELAMKDEKAVSDLIQDHITWMENVDPSRVDHIEAYAPGYIDMHVKAVKSWLGHFDIKLKRKFRITNAGATPTLEDEKVPESAELAEMFNRAELRTAVMESLIAKAGLRPETLGYVDATDGLVMADLPDIVIQAGEARVLEMPPMIIVRKTVSKARHQYFTFLSPQGTMKLIAYLNDRLSKGHTLNARSPVIAPDMDHHYGRRNNKNKAFLTTHAITKTIRESFRPRFDWRPYLLRSFFDTQLLTGEARGLIAHDFRVFFMGHKGNIEARYTTNKSRLPEALLKEMKESFMRCAPLLDIEVKHEDPILKQKEELKRVIEGATPDKVQEISRMLGICNAFNG